MNIYPIEDFVITHPKDSNGNEIRNIFSLSFSKKIESLKSKLIPFMTSLPGIDAWQPAGHYTLEAVIAKTFNPEDILNYIKENLKQEVLSDLVIAVPKPNIHLVK